MRNWFLLVLLVFPLWAHAQSSPSIGAGQVGCNPTASPGPVIGCSSLPTAVTFGFGNITGATNTQATMVVGSGASVGPGGTGTIDATQVDNGRGGSINFALPVNPLTLGLNICGPSQNAACVADHVTNLWPAFVNLYNQGYNNILLPENGVLIPYAVGNVCGLAGTSACTVNPANTIPANMNIIGQNWNTSHIYSSNGNTISLGANARVSNICQLGAFNNPQPMNINKCTAARQIVNNSNVTDNGTTPTLHTWSGETTMKIGPTMLSPDPWVGFTGTVTSSPGTLTSDGVQILSDLFGNGQYGFLFCGKYIRLVTVSGTSASWSSGGAIPGGCTSAQVEMVAFTTNMSGQVTGTTNQAFPVPNAPEPSGSFAYYTLFTEIDNTTGAITTEERTIPASGISGTTWTWTGALASGKTILSANIESIDLPNLSLENYAQGDTMYIGCENATFGQCNGIRIVQEANTPGQDNGIYDFIAHANPTAQHVGYYAKLYNEGNLSKGQQTGIYIDSVGDTVNTGTAFYADDNGSRQTGTGTGTTHDVLQFNYTVLKGGGNGHCTPTGMHPSNPVNGCTDGHFLHLVQGTDLADYPDLVPFGGDFLHIDANQDNNGFTGNLIQAWNYTTNVFQVDAAGDVTTTGAYVGTGNVTGAVGSFTKLNSSDTTSGAKLAGVTGGGGAGAGNIGESVWVACPANGTSDGSTGVGVQVTVASGTPGTITWPSPGLPAAGSSGAYGWGCPVQLVSAGTPPTGLTVGVVYWITGSSVSTNTFSLSSTYTLAIAGTSDVTISTNGATVFMAIGNIASGSAGANTATQQGAALNIPAGNFLCTGTPDYFSSTTATTTTGFDAGMSTSPTTGRNTSGQAAMAWFGRHFVTGTFAANVVEEFAVGQVNEVFTTTTPLYIDDEVTAGQYANFFLGGGINCLRYH